MSFKFVGKWLLGRNRLVPYQELPIYLGSSLLGLVVGVLLAARFGWWWGGVFLVAGLIGRVQRRNWGVMFLTLGLIGGGIFWGGRAEAEFNRQTLRSRLGQRVTLLGEVAEFPRVSLKSNSFILKVESADSTLTEALVLVVSGLYPETPYGSKVAVSCQLRLSRGRANNNWFRRAVEADCWAPFMRVVTPPVGLKKFLGDFRNFLKLRSARVLPEPEGSLMRGLVYGADDDLPADLKEDFRITNLAHLTAVSGSNVSVIVQGLHAFLVAYLVSRRRAVWLAAGLLLIFISVVGFDTSVVRAAIMGGVLLLGKFFGRPASRMNLFGVAVVAMIGVNPAWLHDLGFALSVVATFGVMFVAPKLKKFSAFLVSFTFMRDSFQTSVAVMLMTLPLIAWSLGKLSLIGLLANILVLSSLSVVFALSLFTLILSWFSEFLAYCLALLTGLGLDYIIWVAKTLAAVPGAQLAFAWPGWLLILWYLILAWWLWRRSTSLYSGANPSLIQSSSGGDPRIHG